ncbi:MAG TPA: DNA polymerase/3'-5' exonuclease PolX [Candidatus Limnocylindrales bacterium]|nr:DNA polymerase/3'-5' exonuclease PolX [Candidatus Limnocylindrales bacterium]
MPDREKAATPAARMPAPSDHADADAGAGTAPPDAVPLLTNLELARAFIEIGDLLELKGENRFKVQAYRRAAEEIAHSSVSLAEAYRAGRPPRLPGVGAAIAEKLHELAATGRLAFLERLRAEMPASLVELLALPGVGPSTARELHRRLGVRTLADLEEAVRSGALRSLPGIGERTEERVRAGLANLEAGRPRLRLGEADALFSRLAEALAAAVPVGRVAAAGSLRRRRETVGDLDVLVEGEQAAQVIDALVGLSPVERVVNRGGHRATVQLLRGPQVDLMVMPPGRAGTYLVHFTGSAEHNVRLRELARDRGWSLSEHGFTRLLDGAGDDPSDAREVRTFATEEEVYAFLDLPYVAPELREDRGEVEAALAGRLPRLVEAGDLQGDCHSHSEWSDGHLAIEQVAEAMRARGYAYQVLTDHTRSLTIANGLDPARFAEQRHIIDQLNERFAREEAEGTAPDGGHPDGFRLLHGCELEIRTDGQLDLPDEVLAGFDVVVASLHVGRRQPRAQLMQRYMTALRSPHVDIIAHPSGRKIGIRDDLDLDWETLFGEAARTGTLLEINGSDERLDLDDRRARQARDAGCRLVIDSDAHYLSELANIDFGVSLARRAWIEAADVMNTRSREELLDWVAGKAGRAGR